MSMVSDILADLVYAMIPEEFPWDEPDSVIFQHGMRNGTQMYMDPILPGDFIFVRTGHPATPPYDRGIHSAWDVDDPSDVHSAIYIISDVYYGDVIYEGQEYPSYWKALLISGHGPKEWTWDLSIFPMSQVQTPRPHLIGGDTPNPYAWRVVRDGEVLWEVSHGVA